MATDELDEETTTTTSDTTTTTPSEDTTTTTPDAPAQDDEPMREHQDPVAEPIWMRNREAAKYRHRAKTAEQARDVALRKLANALRQIVAASNQLRAIDPSAQADAIDALGELDQYFTDDGQIDDSKLSAAITELLEKKPYMAKRVPPAYPFSPATGQRVTASKFEADRRDPLTAALLKRR